MFFLCFCLFSDRIKGRRKKERKKEEDLKRWENENYLDYVYHALYWSTHAPEHTNLCICIVSMSTQARWKPTTGMNRSPYPTEPIRHTAIWPLDNSTHFKVSVNAWLYRQLKICLELSLSLSVCLCLSVCLSLCLCLCLSMSVSVCLSLSVSLSVCLSVSQSVSQSDCLSLCLSLSLKSRKISVNDYQFLGKSLWTGRLSYVLIWTRQLFNNNMRIWQNNLSRGLTVFEIVWYCLLLHDFHKQSKSL